MNTDIEQDNYDSLLSYEGGDEFFETVLGGLANVHCESDDEISSISSSSASSNSSNSQSSIEHSPYVTGGDKRSYVFEDLPDNYNYNDNEMPEDELVEGGDGDISEFITENIPDIAFQSEDFIINGGDKTSDVFQDTAYGGNISDVSADVSDNEVSPLFNTTTDKEQIDSVSDNNVLETMVVNTKKNKDIKNLIKNMIKSL